MCAGVVGGVPQRLSRTAPKKRSSQLGAARRTPRSAHACAALRHAALLEHTARRRGVGWALLRSSLGAQSHRCVLDTTHSAASARLRSCANGALRANGAVGGGRLQLIQLRLCSTFYGWPVADAPAGWQHRL